jgi:hypothetical protein
MDNIFIWGLMVTFVIIAMSFKILDLKRKNASAEQRIQFLQMQNAKIANRRLVKAGLDISM